ncbi:MAG: Holliday junction branch migration protein RuvA [Tenuifilum sp.]|jgi:Holliday junction DNA helicase RuvA|uniref:Holliday junction branch migration protein RuvA n=1 Tax=Tenuifilum TaxID=2760873 RepID=UPI001B4E83E8|nr:Holliday junction branch migration protein RuvA [Bacteroidales bacterium]HOK60500.1 Holliday junction branch migration protein RuvA [Tenuifilum sp.]HOK85506.1 Holliday junction branch migration protein RuvA [Tenuifilum sp.]HON70001.1 Holliday junction branch migration protein RuvA [Tenuifilum sp.]HOU73428.1 Holliday junction branch migration protein RuvA [Tenuifilum sp.]
MYEYIQGSLAELTPTHAIVDAGGVGYFVNISLQTYSQLEGKTQVKLWLHQIIREDAHLLYGFTDVREREIFRLLISVSGVGASTARLILSSLTTDEIQAAITTENVNLIKQVKGIGLKTAQRIVVDLKDKVSIGEATVSQILSTSNNTLKSEALSALVMLGFARSAADKVIDQVLKEMGQMPVEALIKHALKRL